MEDCTLAYGAFNRCRWWALQAQRCDFSGADMAEMDLHYITLDDSRFIGTSFFRTPLLGLDFTTCQLEGVTLSDHHGRDLRHENESLSGSSPRTAPRRYRRGVAVRAFSNALPDPKRTPAAVKPLLSRMLAKSAHCA